MTANAQPIEADHFLTPEETAEILRVAPSTLIRWRRQKIGPPFVRLGHRTVRYSAAVVDGWMKSQTRASLVALSKPAED